MTDTGISNGDVLVVDRSTALFCVLLDNTKGRAKSMTLPFVNHYVTIDYQPFFFLRATPASPARPVPKSSIVAGSGMGVGAKEVPFCAPCPV